MTQPPPGAVAPASATANTTAPAAASAAAVLNPRLFGKIILTLENCLLSEAKLTETPSRQDGLDRTTEIDLRILGCELIQTAGILLKLPQVAMATGQVLFQRFYYSKSFVRHGMETTAMSCVCLASKIEEAPRRIRDVINVFHHIRQVRAQKPIIPMLLDGAYISHKTQIIKAERRVLKELGFCVHVKHPHKLIVMYLQVLGYEKNQRLMQSAWNYMNDSLRTDVFMRHTPETIACACIYLTARRLALPLPNAPPWYGVLRVTEDDIIDVAYRITELYRRAKPNVEQLEQAVDALCKRHADARQKNRPGGLGTPPATTVVSTAPTVTVVTATLPPAAVQTVTMADRNNGGSHNAWGGFISRALPLVQPTVPAAVTVVPLTTVPANTAAGGIGAVVVNHLASVGLVGAAAIVATASVADNVSHVDVNAGDMAVPPTQKRSISPRSRSRSPQHQQQTQLQRSPGGGPGGNSNSRDDSAEHQLGSRARKKSRHRSPVGGGRSDGKYEKKKSSRNYSRSASSSPGGGHGRHKKRDRKSPARCIEKSSGDYYSNGSGDRDRSRDHRDSGGSRSAKDRNSGSRGGGGDRDRDRDRSKNDRYGGGGRSGGGTSSSVNNNRSSGKHRERSRDRSPDRSRDRKR